MTKLMQTASALTLTAALVSWPLMATAQQTTEQAAEQAADQAAGAAVEAVDQAAGAAAEVTGQASDQSGASDAQSSGQGSSGQSAGSGAQAAGQGSGDEAAGQGSSDEAAGSSDQATGQAAGAGMAEGKQPSKDVPGTIMMQDKDSILVSNLIGATVYNPKGEAIGTISDAIVSLEGTVDGVVIGVGGFLGIGEKLVAVELQQITVQTNENNQPQLLLDTTYEALEAAPAFVNVQEQKAQMQQEKIKQQQQGGMAPGTSTAPQGGATAPAAPSSAN